MAHPGRWSEAPLAERVEDLRAIERRRTAAAALAGRPLEELARRTLDPGALDPGWEAAYAEAAAALAAEVG